MSDKSYDQSIADIMSSELFAPFINESSDSSAVNPMHGMTINEQIIKITNGIDILNKTIQSLVADNYEELLAQTTKIDSLEEVLKLIRTRIQNLLRSVQKVRSKLVEPYEQICQQIVVLNRLQTTCDLLRRTIRVMHLSKRLNESRLNDTEPTLLAREMIKTGQYVYQIEEIVSEDTEGQLNRIHVIKNDLKGVASIRSALIEKADYILSKSLAEEDNNQLGAALQVFFSLKILDQKIKKISDEKEDEIYRTVNDAIDVSALNQNPKGPGRVVIPMTIAQNNLIRSTLRQNIESLVEKIHSAFTQMSSIYKILKKRRDSLTNSCFIEQLSSSDGLNQFWIHVTKCLSEQLCKAANESAVVRQALETEYPNYLNCLSELWKRINRDHKELNAEKVLRSALQAFESAYLQRSVSILFDSVNKVFADANEGPVPSNTDYSDNVFNVPSVEDIDSIVRHISNELQVSTVDPNLFKSVAKNVTKVINLFAVKCEQLTSVDGNSTQVIGPLTISQRLNAIIIDRLNSFRTKIKALLATLTNCPIDLIKSIDESLICVENLMTNTINPMMNSVLDAIEAILLTMHSENYNDQIDNNSDVRASEYMRELQTFIARISNDYFKEFPECEIIQICIDRVADRTIQLFLRQITLIRPISQSGRMRIAADFAQLEMAITPLCQPIGRLGKTYRVLRSFKPLLIQNAESIAKSGAVGDLIPYSLILQWLISSSAPNELKSPHQYMNWSLSRYNKWLDQHLDETERLALIKNCLESYVKHIRQSQGKAFASVYPVLLDLLQKGLQKSENDD